MGIFTRSPLCMVLAMLLLAGCEHASTKGRPLRVASTRGGAVVLSGDERIAVAVHRSAGVVSVCRLDPGQELLTLLREEDCHAVDLGEGTEPWAAVLGADDDTAYVISRRDQQVFRLVDLHGAPRLDGSLEVGSEPTSIVIAPSGRRLFVANWGEGTISVITTDDFVQKAKLDLNAALAETGVLGELRARPALAHPRALALSDDGDLDDGDETLYATEFFSQPLPDETLREQFDRNRQGLVYPIRLSEGGRVRPPIGIGPVADTGFLDANNLGLPAEQREPTGCFPNQLYAAAVAGSRLFVTSMCASPAGPVAAGSDPNPNSAHFKTVVHPALFVIDTETERELPEQRAVLTHELELRYAEDEAAEGEIRMPLIPNDLAFAASEAGEPLEGCLTAMGADALFCFRYDDGGLVELGAPGARFVKLDQRLPMGREQARLPVGLAFSVRSERPFALVVSDRTQTLSVVDRSEPLLVATALVTSGVEHAAATRDTPANRGRELFVTGLRGWSYAGQAWSSCESCHPDGLSDGVTWFFSRGPRRTLSTAPTYDAQGQQRMLLWGANTDEVHDVEGIVRTISGGTGAILWEYSSNPVDRQLRILFAGETELNGGKPSSVLRNNLNGSLAEVLGDRACDVQAEHCDQSSMTDWNDIDAYIREVRTPRAPRELDADQLQLGEALFAQGRCANCHGGPNWTLSRRFYAPDQANNGSLPFEKPPDLKPDQLGDLRTHSYAVDLDLAHLNPPALVSCAEHCEAPLRRWEPDMTSPLVEQAYAVDTHLRDQINCVLRDVGTFPRQPAEGAPDTAGIAVPGAPARRELRPDMSTLALGASGFNVPSLLGLASGAPYLHAGNARTLEELFDPVFAGHHAAVVDFLPAEQPGRSAEVSALVSYLLSLDEESAPAAGDPRYDFCP